MGFLWPKSRGIKLSRWISASSSCSSRWCLRWWWPGSLLSISLSPCTLFSSLPPCRYIYIQWSLDRFLCERKKKTKKRRRRRKEQKERVRERERERERGSDRRSAEASVEAKKPGSFRRPQHRSLAPPFARWTLRTVLLFCESFLRQWRVGVLWRILHRWLVKSSPPGRGPERCQWLAQPDLCYDQHSLSLPPRVLQLLIPSPQLSRPPLPFSSLFISRSFWFSSYCCVPIRHRIFLVSPRSSRWGFARYRQD